MRIKLIFPIALLGHHRLPDQNKKKIRDSVLKIIISHGGAKRSYKVLYIFRKLNSSGFQNYIAFLYLYIIYENINRKP